MKKLKTWQIVLLVIFYPIGICVWIYRSWKKKKIIRDREEAAAAKAEAKSREEAARKAETEARYKAYKDSHEELTFKVVGVTFSNPDGTKRQALLDKLLRRKPPFAEKKDDDGIEITIERGEYEGEPAFSVYANGYQLGNIGREDIPFFVKRWYDFERVTNGSIYGGGTDDEGHAINYGLRIDCLFKKQPQANN